jgi:putative oxidoreductase
MIGSQGQSRLYIPALAPFYDRVAWLGYPLMRFTVGAMIIIHGWPKLAGGLGPVITTMERQGFRPAWLVAILITATETIGGACVALGFLTRFWAAALAIELGVITFVVQWPRGIDRYEMFLLWGLMALGIALKGGGRLSVDRMIGREF